MNPFALAAALEFLGSWLEFQAGEVDLPGYSVAVWHGADLVFNQAYGFANVESGQPLTPAHLFNIGSQTKMFTAVAIQQLAGRGRLSLDDYAIRHLPWLHGHPDQRFKFITIRQLMWHGAGLVRDGAAADYWQQMSPFPATAELQQLILSTNLATDSGQKLKYSNLGYALLGQIIESASGQSYAEYVSDHIARPLALTTLTTAPSATHGPLATSYSRRAARHRHPEANGSIPTHAFTAVTGLHATPADLARFLAALLPGDQRLLTDNHKLELINPARGHWLPPDQRGTDYGLGFMSLPLGGHKLIGHGGSFIGNRSATYLNPALGLAISVAANAKDAPVIDMLSGIAGVFDYFNRHATIPTPPARAKFNARLANVWQVFEIVATADRIVAVFPDDWMPFESISAELTPTGANQLTIKHAPDLASPAEIVDFHFNSDGTLTNVNFAGTTAYPV